MHRLGKYCILCRRETTMTWEHVLAANLFTYPKGPQAQVTCKECNERVRACEREFFTDPFIQQAKASLRPVSSRDKQRRGWLINYDIAYHQRSPKHTFLVDPDENPVAVVTPLSSEDVWRAMAKSILVYGVFFVGNEVFSSEVDPVRGYVLEGGSHEELRLLRGPNPRSNRWEDFHELRVEFTDDDRFAVFIDLFGRYNFGLTFPVPLRRTDRREAISLLKVGVLELNWLVQSFGKDGKELQHLRNFGEYPIQLSKAFFEKQLSVPKSSESTQRDSEESAE